MHAHARAPTHTELSVVVSDVMRVVCVVLQVMRSITRCELTRRCVFWSEWECRMPKPSPLSRGERTWWQMGNAGPQTYTQQERHMSVSLCLFFFCSYSILTLCFLFLTFPQTRSPGVCNALYDMCAVHMKGKRIHLFI